MHHIMAYVVQFRWHGSSTVFYRASASHHTASILLVGKQLKSAGGIAPGKLAEGVE